MNLPQMYESDSISVLSDVAMVAAFILSPRVLIIYAWIISANVFTYSINFDKQDEMQLLAKFKKFCTRGSEPP